MTMIEEIKKVQTDQKRTMTLLRQVLAAVEGVQAAAGSSSGFDPSLRIALTDPTADAIGWGKRKTKTMSIGGLMQTTMRLAAENAQGIKRTREEIAKMADEEDAKASGE